MSFIIMPYFTGSAMGDLSKNFSRAEFACHCGCGFDSPDARLIILLQAVRDYYGLPIKVLSGCRCAKHNKKVGGASRSQHLLGFAADIAIIGVAPFDLAGVLNAAFRDLFGGLGIYRGFVHVDVRHWRARWSGL